MSIPPMTTADADRLAAAMQSRPSYREWYRLVGYKLPMASDPEQCWEAARMVGYLQGVQAGRDEQIARYRVHVQRIRAELADLERVELTPGDPAPDPAPNRHD